MMLLLLLAAALAQPPQHTLDDLGAALDRLEDPVQVHTLRVVTEVVHSKADGDDRQVERVVSAVENGAQGREVVVLEHTRNGEPVTDEREERERVEVILPGEARDRYTFGPTRVHEGVCVVDFEPASGQPTQGLATGQLAWQEATGQPLWIEFEPVKLSWLVKSLRTRLQLASTEPLHTARVHSEGVGGVPGMRRHFTMDMVIEEVGWAR